MKPRHAVPVAVDAPLGPIDHGKEAHAVALQPAAHLVPRACDVLLGPRSRPSVVLLDLGAPNPVLQRQLDAVLDPQSPLLTRVDHEHAAERLPGKSSDLVGRTSIE